MTKYREYFEKMLEDNKEAFEEFRKIHDAYSLDPDGVQEQLNAVGSRILEIIREYENRLCANTERGVYSKFSEALAEKFQNLIRQRFPMIDYIGLKVSKKDDQKFYIKKINLI